MPQSTGSKKTLPTSRRTGRPRATGLLVSDDPRLEIMKHAARLMAEQGFAGTSTRQIAQACGLRQPSLFHYFPKKDDLLLALIDEAYSQNLKRIQAHGQGPEKAGVRLHAAVISEINETDSFLVDLSSLISSPEVRNSYSGKALKQKLLRVWRKLIVEGQSTGQFREGDATTFARFIQGLIDQSCERDMNRTKRRQVAQDTADFILAGLKPGRKK